MMMRSFELILQNPSVETRPPCSDVEIDVLERQFSVLIPEVLKDFWKSSNGAVLKDHNGSLLGVGEVAELLSGSFKEWWRDAGFLPLLFDQEASYVCMAVRAPMSPRVVELRYYETPHLLYRDWGALFESCVELLATSDCAHGYFYDKDCDFEPDADRSTEDLEAAAVLMQSDEDWKKYLAIQLLDVHSTNAWFELLNGSIFARHEARARLKRMSFKEAKQILKRDDIEFNEFKLAVRQALENSGIGLEYWHDHIGIHGKLIDLNNFYCRRHIDNAIPRLVNWFRDVKSGKEPTERAGPYMTD